MIRTSVLLAALAAPLVAQSPFEGSVTLRVVGGRGEVLSLTYLTKGGKTRIEQLAGKGAMILDSGSRKMLMIMTAQKMYMEMEMKSPADAEKAIVAGSRTGVEGMGEAGKKMQRLLAAQPKNGVLALKDSVDAAKRAAPRITNVEPTGRMEMIAGYRCEHVMVTDDDGAVVDVCVSTELGPFRMPMVGGPTSPPKESGWASSLGHNSFPLKAQKGDKVIFEVTAIERRSLDAALFEAPGGFTKFEMPSMPKRPPER